MSQHDDIRASYLVFPGWTQNFWTWLTGKALTGQKPLFRHTWYSYLVVTLSLFFGGLTLSSLALVYKPKGCWAVLLMMGWILSLCGARHMILVIAHQCIHRQFSGHPNADRFWGELVTLLNSYQDAHAFKVEHFDAHHREQVFATPNDPPVQVIISLGFRPGMTRRQLWMRAFVVFLSPAFYLKGFADRLRCNLTSGTWRRLGFLLWAAWWLSLPFWLRNGTEVLLLAYMVPIVLLNQLSALLDKLGEHAWLTPSDPRHGRRNYHVAASWARFCGYAVPSHSLPIERRLLAWVRWTIAMLLYHLPARLMVVVGDLPNHDFHHRFPRTADWMAAAYARQRDIDSGRRDAPAYVEIWGMGEAIDHMFRKLSSMRVDTVPEGADSRVRFGRAGES